MCPDLECVPLLVRTCCTMVEEKGLDIVGIYRVPGNSAAVNALTEQVSLYLAFFSIFRLFLTLLVPDKKNLNSLIDLDL